MSDQLKDAAAQVILAALHTAEQTGEWIKGQIPDVLHQLLAWNAVSDGVSIGIGLLAIITSAVLVPKAIRNYSNERATWCAANATKSTAYWEPTPKAYCLNGIAIASLLLAAFGIVVALANAYDLLEILIAPKVWILEYARHLL